MVREEDLPIDIYYNKLLDWLIDRRHSNSKWQDNASAIREKINTAIQDMPPNDEITELLSGTYINYFHCERIVELLKECGEGSTNFFGQYSSQRMKDWQLICQQYKEDNVYLAEAAHMLMANVNFEVPALKRQIGKCQQLQQECSRKEQDCINSSSKYREKYHQHCKEISLTGVDVKKELLELVATLPQTFDVIAEDVTKLSDVVEFYRSFSSFVAQRDIPDEDICPLIDFVIKNGNATVYQWKTGKVPTGIEKTVQKVDLEAMVENNVTTDGGDDNEEIDWGGDDNEEGAIDWGGDEDADGIDWGADGGDGEIDWGDSGVSLNDGGEELVITVQDSGIENPEGDVGGVAAGDEAETVLMLTRTRNMFIDELLELRYFLEQRLTEMNDDADIITVNQLQLAPRVVQLQTYETVKWMLDTVMDIQGQFSSKKMKNLFLIRSSPRYVDRIADSLLQKLHTSEKLIKQAATLSTKATKAAELQVATTPKLQVIVAKTKTLQGQIEKEISSRYKGRKVNIMGEINTI